MREEKIQPSRLTDDSQILDEGGLVECFKDGWKKAVEGGVPPSLESYLARTNDESVQQALRKVDADFSAVWNRTRSQHGDQTITEEPGERTSDGAMACSSDHTEGERRNEQLPHRGEVGHFELIEELGRGGMGVVFKARDKSANRLVALKMMLAGQFASPDATRRFRIEAESAANLDHPNIVPIYFVGEMDDMPYFAMKFVDGVGLDSVDQARFAKAPRAAADLVRRAALAIQYAHSRGILHRDLKPANILIDKAGDPNITDFGLAKRLDDDSSVTRTGAVVGTPDYMSPEQATGQTKRITVATDVYSLGSILFDLLTGEPPFRSATVMQTLTRVSKEPARAPAQLNRHVDPDLETICLKCLEKEPENRYASALDLAEELQRYLDGEPIDARPIGRVERLRRWCWRNPVVASLTATVLALFVAWLIGLNVAIVQISHQRDLANANEKAAVAARKKADEQARVAQRARDRSRYNEGLAYQMAYDIVDKFQDELRDRPGLQELRRESLQIALDGLNQMDEETFLKNMEEVTSRFGENAGSKFVGLRAEAGVHQRGGSILLELGLVDQAREKFQTATDLAEQMDRQVPGHPVCKRNLAAASNNLADAYRRLGDFEACLLHYQRGLEFRKQQVELMSRQEDLNKWRLVEAKWNVAVSYLLISNTHLLLGHPQDARENMILASPWRAAVPEDVRFTNENEFLEMAMFNSTQGTIALHFEGIEKAQSYYRDSIELLQSGLTKLQSSQGANKGVRLQKELVKQHLVIGDALMNIANDLVAAADHYRAAEEISVNLHTLDPDDVQAASLVATVYYKQGTLTQANGDLPASRVLYQRALDLLEQLTANSSEDALIQADLMMTLARLGRVDEAIQMIQRMHERFPAQVASLLKARCYAVCALLSWNSDASNVDGDENVEMALAALEAALNSGCQDRQTIQTHPDFALLHRNFAERLQSILGSLDSL